MADSTVVPTRSATSCRLSVIPISTPAFKREAVEFQEYMVPVPATEADGSGTVDVSYVLHTGISRDPCVGAILAGSPAAITAQT